MNWNSTAIPYDKYSRGIWIPELADILRLLQASAGNSISVQTASRFRIHRRQSATNARIDVDSGSEEAGGTWHHQRCVF